MPNPDVETITLATKNGQKYLVKVRRYSRGKYLRIRLEQNGAVVISAPATTSMAIVARFAREKWPQLEPLLEKFKPESPNIPETIHWPGDGADYPIIASTEAKIGIAQAGGALKVSGPDASSRIYALQAYFRARALEPIAKMMATLAQGLDLSKFASFNLRVGDQRRRMGSCSIHRDKSKKLVSKPTICINWRATFLPAPLAQHLCLHEIAHIIHANHSRDFYNLLESLSPNCRQVEKNLSLAWKSLPDWVLLHG